MTNPLAYPPVRLALALAVALALAWLVGCGTAEAQSTTGRSSLRLPAAVFVGLQAADVHSTHLGRSRGATEANPAMRLSTPQQAAVKAAATVGTLLALDRLHRTRPRLARAVLWTLNGVMAGVVARNYRVAYQLGQLQPPPPRPVSILCAPQPSPLPCSLPGAGVQ